MRIFMIALSFLLGVVRVEAAESIVAQLPWDSGYEEYKVLVSETHDDGFPNRTISFIPADEAKKTISFETSDAFVSAFTLQDVGGCLVSLWTGGSAYHVRVFQAKDNSVSQVLEDGSKTSLNIHSTEVSEVCPTIQVEYDGKLIEYQWQQESYKAIVSAGRDSYLQE